MSLDNPTPLRSVARIRPGGVVVPRGFTATPEARFRVIRRRGPFLYVRMIACPSSERSDGLGEDFPIHLSECRRPGQW